MLNNNCSNILLPRFREQEREEGRQHEQVPAKAAVPESLAVENTQAREGEKKPEESVRSAPSSTSITKEQPHEDNTANRVSGCNYGLSGLPDILYLGGLGGF